MMVTMCACLTVTTRNNNSGSETSRAGEDRVHMICGVGYTIYGAAANGIQGRQGCIERLTFENKGMVIRRRGRR